MKTALVALGLLSVLATPVWAGACATDLAILEEAISSAQLEPDTAAQLKDMQAQAEKLCAAGNEEEAADVISEATSMLSQ